MPRPARPVVVVGAGLAALAGAARLAKAGYRTTLLTDGEPLGGRWAPRGHDLSPASISFPAPWRDLFRKSGRPLEDELARDGLVLAPASGPVHSFPDGSRLRLGGRADSHAAVSVLAGAGAADGWQDLVDRLGEVWRQLRFLGLETELRESGQLGPSVRAAVWADRSLADLADDLDRRTGEQRLSAVVADLAAAHGSPPDRVPAWAGVSLFIERTFGHWQILRSTAAAPDADGQTGTEIAEPLPASVLVRLLVRRLELRKVEIRPELRVAGLSVTSRRTEARVDGVLLDDGHRLPAEAVLIAAPPWKFYAALPTGPRLRLTGALPGPVRREAAALARCRTATAPTGTRTPVGQTAANSEQITHGTGQSDRGRSDWGRPVCSSVRRDAEGLVRVELDHRASMPDEAAGIAWQHNWLDRPPTASALTGLFLAGPWSRSGAGPDREILSAALAAGAVVRLLDPT